MVLWRNIPEMTAKIQNLLEVHVIFSTLSNTHTMWVALALASEKMKDHFLLLNYFEVFSLFPLLWMK